MAKILKIIAQSFFIIIEWLLLFIIFFAFAIRTSPVQTFLADYATDYLSKELGTIVSIDKVDIVFVDRVDLKGVLLLNKDQSDTIAKINSLLVNVDGISQFQNKVHLASVALEGGVVKIDKSTDGELNLKFIIDYFKSDKPKNKKTIPFSVDNIYLSDVRFHFDNNTIAPVEKGMDYQHLLISQINLDAENIKMIDGVITADVNNLSAHEKSGFILSDFNSKLKVSNHGVHLQNVNITTPYTDLKSDNFKLLYTSYTQYKSFVDSVAFDADLHDSKVSFKDIAYFAPQLDGMDQEVAIEGTFSKFVKNLKASDFILKTGNYTELRGTINLPDFRHLKESFYQERLSYAYVNLNDLQAIKMPEISSSKYIQLNDNVKSLVFIEANDVRLDGLYSQFVVSSDLVKTKIGSVNMDNGILFTHNPANNSFLFAHSEASEYDVKVNEFDLGKYLNNSNFGVVDGTFFLSGEAYSFSSIDFNTIEGDVNRFDLADYSYSNIEVKNTSFVDKKLYAEVHVNDKNIKLDYKGTIDLTTDQPVMDMTADIDKAMLGKLNFTDDITSNLTAKLDLHTTGVNPNTMQGNAVVHDIVYLQGTRRIDIPSVKLDVQRGLKDDIFKLNSSLVNASVKGKIDFTTIGDIFLDQVAHIFPGLINLTKDKHNHHAELNSNDHMNFDVELFDVSKLLAIFRPELSLSSGTHLQGNYQASNRSFDLYLKSDNISYNQINASGLNVIQTADSNSINAEFTVLKFNLNDSIALDSLKFVGSGNGDNLESILTWNPGTENASDIRWNTNIISASQYRFIFDPSYFAINKQHWNIEKEAIVEVDSSSVNVEGLKLVSNQQAVSVYGKISQNDADKMNFEANEVDLHKLGLMLGLNVALDGTVNGWGYISNPYKNLTYMGDLNAKGLKVNQEDVGDVFVQSQWDTQKNMIDLSGDLIYRGVPTFQFKGNYDVNKETDNLDFDLVFDQTNISFANAFMDPLVVDEIKGFLNGELAVTGSINRPIIEGKVKLDKGSAKITILGTSFTIDGAISADKDGFYIDYIPISDVEGNTGSLTGSIYHTDYKKWNFNIDINVEDDYYKRDPKQNWVKLPLERFLVMNTNGKNGDLYYGKAYGTGTVGIFGYLDNLEINVDMKTQKGTAVDLNLFAQTELTEDNFIEFVPHDTTAIKDAPKIDFSGVTLNLNFDLNPNAQIKMIFNEQTGDEITAFGNGRLALGMDNLGQLSLEGTYTVSEGSKYNFVLGPIKETFYISDGGSITWTGNPYEASLNLKAYYKLKANLGELSPELLASGNQEVNCYLNLTESLMKPNIDFDIKAPKAPESDKSLLTQLTADKDELNRQFFSLLLWKKFQPMKGSSRASGGAALDMASNQINSLLSQVSQDYKLNVDMNSDAQGGSEYALGIEKGFLNDQLVISGSFGTRNSAAGSQTHSSLIGDIEIEYKLNKDGTFRINVFNESNDNRVLQTSNRGQFKQGVGIYYKENFNTLNDFRLLQQFFDIFRKKQNKRYPIRRKKQQTPVPKDGILPEE